MIKKENIFKGSKFIGTIYYEKGAYVSFRDKTHIFHIFNDGWGASKKLLVFLRLKGIEIFIINYENKEGYWCNIEDFYKYGKEWNDNGDLQLILERQFWRTQDEIIPTEEQVKL